MEIKIREMAKQECKCPDSKENAFFFFSILSYNVISRENEYWDGVGESERGI